MSEPTIKRKWLAYTWRTIVNLIALLVVWFVFASVNGRDTRITLAAIGLLYVAVRSTAMGQGTYFMLAIAGLGKDLDELKAGVTGEPVNMATHAALDEAIFHSQVKMFIDSVLLVLVGLTCLLQLLSAL
jgi:hypothetical protein